ncbi:MAG TPA: DUF72 domain-containing protein [Candidatus Dormibacteraeota bacterium]|nr:DUF72 domain-containing protein [Candidatus Dormibacteraeota bacterium]
MTAPGTFRSGTSGFAYADWSPKFYPPGTRPEGRLASYASRLSAVELNNTFYRRPSPDQLLAWRAQVGPDFRFIVKAQRGASLRAVRADASASVAWVTEGLDQLGGSLGGVLFRVPAAIPRDDARLRVVLDAWPRSVPLVVELQDASWHVDETFAALRDAGAVLCATDLDGSPAPDLRVTGGFLYLRLRRTSYDPPALEAWGARLAPFLAAGLDAYAFLRHDDDGASALAAERLSIVVSDRVQAEQAGRGGRLR